MTLRLRRQTLARFILPALLATGWLPNSAGGVWVYFTPKEAVEVAFSDGEDVERVPWARLLPEQKQTIESRTGKVLVFHLIRCYQGSKDGQVVGYACIDNVIGRSRPITYMVKIGHPTGDIEFYEVLVYREQIGKEVRKGPFREQFFGKSLADPLEYGEDLRNYEGATLSAVHLRDGFRRLLLVYDHFLKQLPVLHGG